MKLALLFGVAMAPLAFAGMASAQIAAAPTATDQVDEIVVVGRRPIAESEAAALRVQRNSDSLVTVVASDSVGRLPDQNIAQAVGRLPGAAVESDQGQPRYISLRGAPKNWTTLSIDGIGIVSPEGRDTRYDSLPSAIASQIIVSKAVTPDMNGETISGNVNIITRSAFDYSGLHVAGKAGGGYVELGDRREYEGQLLVSNRWNTGIGEIGILASGSYYERNMVTDNYEIDWETVTQDRQPGGAGATVPGDRLWAREIENKLYRLTRTNYSQTGRIDWAPNENNRLFFQSIYTTFQDDEARDNFLFDTDDRQSEASRPARSAASPCVVAPVTTVTNSGYADTCIGNTSLVGTVYGIDVNQRATLRAYEQSIFTNTLGGHHEIGAWTANWRLNFTRAIDDRSVVGEARYESPLGTGNFNLRPTIAYDFNDVDFQNIRLYRTVVNGVFPNAFYSAGDRVTNIDDFQRDLTQLTSLKAVDETEAYTARFDLNHETSLFGGDARMTFGGQYDQRTKEANEAQLFLATNNPGQNAILTAANVSRTYLPVSLDIPFKGKIPLAYTFRYFDLQAMRDQVARAVAAGGTYNPVPANYYKVEEKVTSAYGMLRIGYDWGSILGGVRVEHISNTGDGLAVSSATPPVVAPLHAENDMTLVYPSLHVNYDVTDDIKLRVSLNTGAARPDYDQLRPTLTYNDSNGTISAGNPDAKPERAYGADAYLEWYIRPQGYAMIGVFYKKVEDVLFSSTRTFGSDALGSNGATPRSTYTLTTIDNGGDGYLYGVEAALQQQLEPFTEQFNLPDWVGGFGVSANVTLNASEATAPDGSKVSLPNTSDVVANIGAYYEKYGFSARLNYRYRTEWLDAFGAAVDGGNTFWATDDELDFSARYALNDHLEVYVDGSNLLDNPGRRYSRESAYTIEWEQFGSRYDIGLRFNF